MNPYPFIYTSFGIVGIAIIGYMALQLRQQAQSRRLLTLVKQGTTHAT